LFPAAFVVQLLFLVQVGGSGGCPCTRRFGLFEFMMYEQSVQTGE